MSGKRPPNPAPAFDELRAIAKAPGADPRIHPLVCELAAAMAYVLRRVGEKQAEIDTLRLNERRGNY